MGVDIQHADRSATAPEDMNLDAEAGVRAKAQRARAASLFLAQATRRQKDAALAAMATDIRAHSRIVLEANAADVQAAQEAGVSAALQDRMRLDSERIEALARALENLAALPDPIGEVLRGSTLANGLQLSQVRVPLGVVGAIYEARPNVTVDIAGLTFKSGNAVLLRGGSAVALTNTALVSIIRNALSERGFPADAVQSIDEYGRAGATALMRATGEVDVLIPRGGHDLIQTVLRQAQVPVIETGEGVVHIFVDESADPEQVIPIVLNAKTQRPSVCNALETLLVHKKYPALPALLEALAQSEVVLHLDATLMQSDLRPEGAQLATEQDWRTEYLAAELAVRLVDDLDEALQHIRTYSTGHTEAILSRDLVNTRRFTAEVDSAVVVVNASTRFTDGSEFGFGAEVGISTQKLHARGPMGLSELTSSKWIVQGSGHVRQ